MGADVIAVITDHLALVVDAGRISGRGAWNLESGERAVAIHKTLDVAVSVNTGHLSVIVNVGRPGLSGAWHIQAYEAIGPSC